MHLGALAIRHPYVTFTINQDHTSRDARIFETEEAKGKHEEPHEQTLFKGTLSVCLSLSFSLSRLLVYNVISSTYGWRLDFTDAGFLGDWPYFGDVTEWI